jgi:hypothetical protein
MGGIGSGRRPGFARRRLTSHVAAVDVRGGARRIPAGSDSVSCGRFLVSVEWTTCHFGGARPWFVCPGCWRRRAALYYAGTLLNCRVCLRLAYPVENEAAMDRALRRAFKIRERLGQTRGGVLSPFPDKPPGMHWRTFIRLFEKSNEAATEALAISAQQTSALLRGFQP